MRVLVTGASGFAGSLLVPRLRADGHSVRALGRDPARVTRALERTRADAARATERLGELELAAADVLTGEGLARAMRDVEVAYYLIHSMERSPAGSAPFATRERIAAERFASHARAAGVRRIVYLGGVQARWSEEGAGTARSSAHLSSREAVEGILLGEVPDSVALRASIVIGARSRSFRLLVRLVERMPVLALPSWQRFRTRPVDARDVTEMLLAAADAPVGGRALDAAGRDIVSYGDIVRRIAELMLVGRRSLSLRVRLTPITARVAAAIAGEDPELVLPLMEGLQGDLLPRGDDAAELLDVPLHSFDAAVENALREWEALEPLAAR